MFVSSSKREESILFHKDGSTCKILELNVKQRVEEILLFKILEVFISEMKNDLTN